MDTMQARILAKSDAKLREMKVKATWVLDENAKLKKPAPMIEVLNMLDLVDWELERRANRRELESLGFAKKTK